MVEKIERITYRCEGCDVEYPEQSDAELCEEFHRKLEACKDLLDGAAELKAELQRLCRHNDTRIIEECCTAIDNDRPSERVMVRSLECKYCGFRWKEQ